MYLPLLFALFQLLSLAHCHKNITLDDNDSKIQYTSGWSRSASTNLDHGGSHVLTTNVSAEAVLQFTGVAVYFMSPLWPYAVSTALTLDSRPTVIVDLTDHKTPDTGGGIETVSSNVVWSAENLPNMNHTLRISIGRGQTFAIIDGIIYTTLDPGESATSHSGDDNHHDRAVIIALATLLAILVLLLLIILIWLCLRKRNSSETRTTRTASRKWRGAAHDDSSISTHEPRGSLQSPPLSPSVAPHSPPPPSRPDSNYLPGETPWSTSSVGGPGVQNMTGVGTSARNSNVMSIHHGDPTHSTSHFTMISQGDLADPRAPGPYLNPNRDGRPRI